jgi:hypothetical protein
MKAHFIHKIVLCSLLVLILPVPARAADPLPSWNDGAARQMILEFVKATTDKNSADYFSPEERIATFDQDDTL